MHNGMITFANTVTSLVEVRIEILKRFEVINAMLVTSLVEVRIEISVQGWNEVMQASLPLWKCGLKLNGVNLIGVLHRHFPCGSAD